MKETFGQTFQVFSDGVDGGRDGAFYGTWSGTGFGDDSSSSFTTQCKHSSKQDMKLSKGVISGELPKIERLVRKGLADVYLLFTNCSVSAETAAVMEEEMRKAGAKFAKIYGAEWINHSISLHPSLRRMVPRIYGLGDLSQIITNQAFRQAKSVLDSIAPDLACFVPTEAYRRCAHALRDHGFVMLIGEPASGKTMIANLLALSAADEWGLQTLILSSPEDLDRQWNPDDPGQFFWVDDAFGSNHCDFNRVQEWNQRLPKLKAAIHKGARVIFTSRSYIFRTAQNRLNANKFELFKDSRVTIEVEKLSEPEKAMILYNHLKLGKQTKAFRRAIKNFLPTVVSVPKFLPEIARRFANPQFTKKPVLSEAAVVDFFSNPTGIMADIIGGLAPAERAALALVFANGGELPIPLRLENPQTTNIITSMQSNFGDVKAALSTLDDSLIRISKTQDEHYWTFRHPTIRDAFATDVSGNPELIEIYLSGVTKERLIEEISCGDMGIEGIKLVVPRSMFNRVLDIITPGDNRLPISRPILSFLASRCSPQFLGLFFNSDKTKADLLDLINSARRYDHSLTILGKLNVNGLLGDELRKKVLDKLSFLAAISHSDCFIDADFVGVLLSQEENDTRLSVQKVKFYTNMNEIIQDIEDSWDTDDDVDEAFYDVTHLLERFRDENNELCNEDFYDEDEWQKSEQFIREIEAKKDRLKQKQSEAVDYDELETEEALNINLPLGRSIFDDVDE
ncbi:AAA family ATPase [Dickeya oryzae]|uniref:AAA family ATPase n=1 Tax=Dickeya oryzae TaxID=1240404 RepID=A0AB39IPS0_9GAMM|nr:AAA family ATPase [Dickeya oryzae]MCA6992304.1 AAA family ATPase [Dickeya oryzae]